MKRIWVLLIFVVINSSLASDCKPEDSKCIKLNSHATITITKNIPPGSSGVKITNNSNQSILISEYFNYPSLKTLQDDGHITICGIYSMTWSQWSAWSGCTTRCGSGSQSRWRICNFPVGAFNPCMDVSTCAGDATESQTCNNTPCCRPITKVIRYGEYENCNIACKDNLLHYCGSAWHRGVSVSGFIWEGDRGCGYPVRGHPQDCGYRTGASSCGPNLDTITSGEATCYCACPD